MLDGLIIADPSGKIIFSRRTYISPDDDEEFPLLNNNNNSANNNNNGNVKANNNNIISPSKGNTSTNSTTSATFAHLIASDPIASAGLVKEQKRYEDLVLDSTVQWATRMVRQVFPLWSRDSTFFNRTTALEPYNYKVATYAEDRFIVYAAAEGLVFMAIGDDEYGELGLMEVVTRTVAAVNATCRKKSGSALAAAEGPLSDRIIKYYAKLCVAMEDIITEGGMLSKPERKLIFHGKN